MAGFDFNKIATSATNSQDALDMYANNLMKQTVAGFKGSDPTFGQIMGGTGITSQRLNMVQGQIYKTSSSSDLAIKGGGFFVVSDGAVQQYTRAGRFQFNEKGEFVTEDGKLKVQGYSIDSSGKKSDRLTNIELKMVPGGYVTPDGRKFNSYKLADDGIVYGEMTITDPLTQRETSHKVPLYRVGVANFANPSALKSISDTTFAPTNQSGNAIFGVAGEGSFGSIQAGHLEMSNVKYEEQTLNYMYQRQAYKSNLTLFTAMNKMTEAAIQLVR